MVLCACASRADVTATVFAALWTREPGGYPISVMFAEELVDVTYTSYHTLSVHNTDMVNSAPISVTATYHCGLDSVDFAANGTPSGIGFFATASTISPLGPGESQTITTNGSLGGHREVGVGWHYGYATSKVTDSATPPNVIDLKHDEDPFEIAVP